MHANDLRRSHPARVWWSSYTSAGRARTIPLALLLTFAVPAGGCLNPPCPPPPERDDQPTTLPAGELFIDQTDPFEAGPLETRTIHVERCERGAPIDMLVLAPKQAGDYAVIVFQHGFVLRNSAYTEVLSRVAAHGFVVVAPQMYDPGIAPLLGHPTADEEADLVLELLDWLPEQLSAIAGVTARTELLGLAGHSRGGKVAWSALLTRPSAALAIAGIDPVDGTGGPRGDQPRVTSEPFELALRTLVVGMGLGGECAPEGENHVVFYEASQTPAWHVVALDHGHVDLLNEDSPDFAFTSNFCQTGENRDALRQLVAGLLVAFFRASLLADAASYAYLEAANQMPVAVTVENK